MGEHAGKLAFFSFLIAMVGLIMLITGLRSDGPNNPYEGFDKAGAGILICGGLLFVLSIYFFRRG
jgi:hypothetical protein